MKRIACILILLFLTFASSFGQENRSIFFEGTAEIRQHRDFFLENFPMEAVAAGYEVVENRRDAGYIFSFEATRNMIEYDDGTKEPVPPGYDQFSIVIAITRNEDSVELASFGFSYNDIYDMYDYTQFLFLKAAVNIPPLVIPDFIEAAPPDLSWMNKWLFLRVSLDLPLTFYNLPTKSSINDNFYKNESVKLQHEVMNYPGLTLGVEVHFLNFMSIEPMVQVGYEPWLDISYLTMAAGAQVKFPLQFLNEVILQPYVGAMYTLPFFIPAEAEEVFTLESSTITQPPQKISARPPTLGISAGLQVGIQGGPLGIVFIDVGFTYYLESVIRKNPYEGFVPSLVEYQRSVLRLGIGYKFGFINR
jgi:hypothetical protein